MKTLAEQINQPANETVTAKGAERDPGHVYTDAPSGVK